MATHEEKQAYVDEMIRAGGGVLDYHKVMARHDFDVLQAANGLVDAAYLKERRLDRKTKELIFVANDSNAGEQAHIQSHVWPWISASQRGDPRGHRDLPARGGGRRIPGRIRGLAGGGGRRGYRTFSRCTRLHSRLGRVQNAISSS